MRKDQSAAWAAALLGSLVAASCGLQAVGEGDAGGTTAGLRPDAGEADAGGAIPDAGGSVDGGVTPDAGPRDGGSSVDGGPEDGGLADGGQAADSGSDGGAVSDGGSGDGGENGDGGPLDGGTNRGAPTCTTVADCQAELGWNVAFPGQCCAGRCSNAQNDTLNCNGCGNVCAADQACICGACKQPYNPAPYCPVGQIYCFCQGATSPSNLDEVCADPIAGCPYYCFSADGC